MPAPILLTKLFIPTNRPELVSRSHLVEQLNGGLHRKLTLISTPAGFGKTTLVTKWIQSQEDDASSPFLVGWVSLDEGDNDAVRFLSYLITALNRTPGLETAIGIDALQMVQSPQPPPLETILIAVINELALVTAKIVLVLDDYHLIDTPHIHECLNFLIENLPPQLHLVITTREDPPIQISRLRARGQLNELRALDLRFTLEEAAQFLNQVMGLNLSAADIAALETRTEGWITGLQMAAISMRGGKDVDGFIKSFTGSHRYVLDYLIEEVLNQQTEDIQTFLLQTSILDRLTGSLCDAVRFGINEMPSSSKGTTVTGQENGQAMLEGLERANLFIIPLDDERRWYRYHHLFADLLLQRLRQTQPEQVSSLHQKASAWFKQNGLIDKAIEHALNAEEFEQAANLIEDQANKVWDQGEHTKLGRWLKALPEKILFTKPQLTIFNAWSLFVNGQDGAAERSLEVAEQAQGIRLESDFENTPTNQDKFPDLDQMKVRGRAAVIRASMASHRRDVSGIIQHARLALEYLPEEDSAWRNIAAIALGDTHAYLGDISAVYQARKEELETSKRSGNIYTTMIASLKLTLILRMQGDLQRAIKICQQQIELANESGLSQTTIAGGILVTWGEILAEINNLDEALHQAKKGINLIELGKDLAMLSWGYVCIIRVLFSRGEMTDAEKIIQKMEKLAREFHVPPAMVDLIAVWQARLWIAQGKLDAASQWVEERGLDVDGAPTFQNEFEHIALARLLISQGHLDEAARLLRALLETAKSGDRTSRVIEILIIQALAYQAGDETVQAVTVLEKALTLAEPGGFIRTFVDEGPPMARLLYLALEKGIFPDYVRKLLAAFPVEKSEQVPQLHPQSQESEWIEPLSDREIEVLQLIAEGLSRQEIATRLVLSMNTVKTHTRNIYGKLGVNNQMQAVGKARGLGLLEND